MEDEQQNGGFKVTDRRRFTTEGETSTQSEETPPQPQAEEQAAGPEQPQTVPREEPPEAERAGAEQLPPIDFATFVLSLANTALFQLGLVKGPNGESRKDLPGARQTIDIIAMLQEKTKGNLTEQEDKILADTLFQLRMAFVEASK